MAIRVTGSYIIPILGAAGVRSGVRYTAICTELAKQSDTTHRFSRITSSLVEVAKLPSTRGVRISSFLIELIKSKNAGGRGWKVSES